MHLSQRQKLVIAVVIFALAGYVLYTTFFPSKPAPIVIEQQASDVNTDVTETDVSSGQDILGIARLFDSITLNTKLFSSPVFQSLTDSNATSSQEMVGRPNPFADIGVDRIVSTTSKPVKKR